MEDDTLDIEVRPANEIAARVLIFHALNRRLVAEALLEGESTPDEDPDELLFDLNALLIESGASSGLTDNDRHLLETPPGHLDDDLELEVASWRHAQQAIMQVCGLAPGGEPWIETEDPDETEEEIDLDAESVRSLSAKLALPTDEEAAAARETAELWFWRSETEADLRQAKGPELRELLSQIADTAAEAAEAGLITAIHGGDFFAGDRTIRDWSEDELAMVTIAAAARLRGLNWLCGFGQTWDDTPTDI